MLTTINNLKRMLGFAYIYNNNFSGGSRNVHKWGPTDCLRGARSCHASVIPYIINQIIFPKKGGVVNPLNPPMNPNRMLGFAYILLISK